MLSKLTSGLKFVVIGSVFLSLVACSSWMGKDSDEDDAGIPGSDSAYSMGAGDAKSFGHGQNSLNAPENQTYFFDYDSSDVHPDDRPAVEAQAKYLADHPKARVVLEGNTDERGSREYNVALGERRAMAVAKVLKSMGVADKQIRVVSYGEEKPLATGHDEEAYRQNRRVNLVYEAK